MELLICSIIASFVLYAILSPRWRFGRAFDLWQQGYTRKAAWRLSSDRGLVRSGCGPSAECYDLMREIDIAKLKISFMEAELAALRGKVFQD
jgi:hypothetical protein